MFWDQHKLLFYLWIVILSHLDSHSHTHSLTHARTHTYTHRRLASFWLAVISLKSCTWNFFPACEQIQIYWVTREKCPWTFSKICPVIFFFAKFHGSKIAVFWPKFTISKVSRATFYRNDSLPEWSVSLCVCVYGVWFVVCWGVVWCVEGRECPPLGGKKSSHRG